MKNIRNMGLKSRVYLVLFFGLILCLEAFAQGSDKTRFAPIYIPQGFVETKDLVYFEIDRNGSKGSVEKVIADYNQYIVGAVPGKDQKIQSKEELLDKKGQPLDWKLRMDIIHPEKPSAPRPVFFIVSTAPIRNIPRHTPFQQLFAKRGYVTVVIDHTYSPLARAFGHKDSYYSLDDITGVKAFTAAVRYLRANAKKYSIDPERIGGLGHSKGSYAIARLSDPNIGPDAEEWRGKIEPYAPQPNLGYPSHIQVGYQSMGNGTRRSIKLVKDNYAPTITVVGKLDKANHWEVWPSVVKAYTQDHDANWLGIAMTDLGHDMAVGLQSDLGYVREQVVEDFFAAYLEPKLSPKVLYTMPFNGAKGETTVGAKVQIAIHFAPQMETESVKNNAKVIEMETGVVLKGVWKVSRKGTYFEFSPESPLRPEVSYRIAIATGAKNIHGVPLSKDFTHDFNIGTTKEK